MRKAFVLLVLCLCPWLAQAQTTFLANNAAITYSPCNWGPSGTAMGQQTPGAYFSVMLTNTTTISVNFIGSTSVSWRVDRDAGVWSTPGAASGATSIPIPTAAASNTNNNHTLEVSFTADSGTGINSITVDSGGGLQAWSPYSNTQVCAFGDSITTGAYVYSATTTDGRLAWSTLLKDMLGINIGSVGISNQTWAGLQSTWSTVGCCLGSRDMTKLDVVLINEGTNDTGNVTSTCIATLNAMLAAAKSTTQFVVLEPFNGTHASELQACVAGTTVPSRTKYLATTGFSQDTGHIHPAGWDNLANIAPKVAQGLITLLGASTISPAGGWHHP